MKKEAIVASGAAAPVAPYSQAIRSNGFVFCSGAVGLDPDSGELVQGFADEVRQAFANMKSVLEGAGLTLEDIVKITVFLVDMDQFAEMNEIYGGYFSKTPPARSTVAVKALPKGASFEIEAIAAA